METTPGPLSQVPETDTGPDHNTEEVDVTDIPQEILSIVCVIHVGVKSFIYLPW